MLEKSVPVYSILLIDLKHLGEEVLGIGGEVGRDD